MSARVSFNDEALLSSQKCSEELSGRGGPKRLARSITQAEMEHPPPPGSGQAKFGTFSGVYIPTALNVLSILMFLRFGFIIGQAGILGTLFLLVLSYSIGLLTTLSLSAISTNGTVRGGGAYYMISRSLGPEFGGSIGVVFYFGQLLNTGLNISGFFEPLIANFGEHSGVVSSTLPESPGFRLLYGTGLLLLCTAVSSVGSALFTKSGKILFVLLHLSILSIPLSLLFVKPYADATYDYAWYTGVSFSTFKQNLIPHFTKGAAGSQVKTRETFQDMFGILFPATSGIMAGASMSGDLRKPSRSIPKGTLWGIASTFMLYVLVILAIGSSVSRELLHKDVQILEDINISPYIILVGELSTSLYSSLVGILGCSKLLQAISRDQILPFSEFFSKGSGAGDNPVRALVCTYILTQFTLLFDINQIAVFITMAYLMTFVVMNLACFLLRIASAPNFRPSFRYFNSYTAGGGAVACVIAMFVADGVSASAMIMVLIALFLLIHYIAPQKPWGDVSQSLIYHQVRKYLLRLRQDHVKFWRPQILLLVDDPRTSWSLMQFCNHLKKGGLYILGHVIVTDDFQNSYPEIKKQQDAWEKLRAMSNIKGFVQIAAASDVAWGARNVYMGSGLGGMKPNITVLGFYEKRNHQHDPNGIPSDQGAIDVEHLPTDVCRKEPSISVAKWVQIIEDLITMHANVAVAKGFPTIEMPTSYLAEKKGYIDLYPIQMSAHIVDEEGRLRALTTNFDTYTLILQMGAILRTVPAWKENHDLRVVVFVEFQQDVESERSRIKLLLEKLRIKATVKVICLSSGKVPTYETLIHGAPDYSGRVSKLLGEDDWWQDLQNAREEWAGKCEDLPPRVVGNLLNIGDENVIAAKKLKEVIKQRKRKHAMSSLRRLGVALRLQTNRLSRKELQMATSGYYDESNSDSDTEWERNSGYSSRNRSNFPSSASSFVDDVDNGSIPPRPRQRGLSISEAKLSPTNDRSHIKSILDSSEVNIPMVQTPKLETPRAASGSGSAAGGDYFDLSRKQDLDTTPKHSPRASIDETQAHVRPSMMRTTSQLLEVNATKRAQKSPVLGPVPAKNVPLMKTLSRSNSTADLTRARKLKPHFSGLAIPQTRVLENADDSRRTIMFEDDAQSGAQTPVRTPSREVSERTALLGGEASQSYGSKGKEKDKSNGDPNGDQTGDSSNAHDKKPENGDDNDDKEDLYLSFNDLPAKAQLVVLNDIMKTASQDSAVIFSTLPAPSPGTYKSESEAKDYVAGLELWCDGLPPVLLLHSQSMTVTTAL